MIIKNLIFDLDGTLYPKNQQVEDNVDNKIASFFCRYFTISHEEALQRIAEIRKKFAYDADAVEYYHISKRDFMEDICDVDVTMLHQDNELSLLLSKLPQRKVIFTDSTQKHVKDVLAQIEVPSSLFSAVYDAGMIDYCFKNQTDSFSKFCNLAGFKASECMIFEDSIPNLQNAKSVGMQTVLIAKDGVADKKSVLCADYIFSDIKDALKELFAIKF